MPTNNSINVSSAGMLGFTGTAFVETAATQFAVLVGGSTSSTISNVGPTATSGQVLQSAGNAANPAFSTATYPASSGGSGKILFDNGTNFIESTPTFPASASATARKIIVSDGTNWLASTETWAVPGTSGNVLTSNGTNWTSAAPASGFTTINIQTFVASGTYTPTASMKYCIVELIGAGGGGGGTPITSATQVAAGSGGGSGAYSRGRFSAATIGVSQTVTMGAGGTGVSGAGGNTGGTSTFGALLQSNGGAGGSAGVVTSATNIQFGGQGAIAGVGTILARGGPGGNSMAIWNTNQSVGVAIAGVGGTAAFAGAQRSVSAASPTTGSTGGNSGDSYGCGGGGAAAMISSGAANIGGDGFIGLCVVTEFI